MRGNRPYNSRHRRKNRPERSPLARENSLYENCRIDPALNSSFRKIGKPGAREFIPDPFQLEAVEKLKDG
jgi:hypothetical protein